MKNVIERIDNKLEVISWDTKHTKQRDRKQKIKNESKRSNIKEKEIQKRYNRKTRKYFIIQILYQGNKLENFPELKKPF